ncbi:sulfite reductase subunit alpha [Undibacterium cyanobacteriorum]|uniref:NADPH--hemoprotein reductase n=1 Tax=Undibacterium cyanobacteriorum TaxID=3073561 RepID=A0ABY9RJ88_9BURK|nr:sulfite reductase subunit alpha [Undibacterium sp. 20NA77.5]WMW81293.1 sulfite reductase subunit alpha [Undibacterium sp. 20NA77.5]
MTSATHSNIPPQSTHETLASSPATELAAQARSQIILMSLSLLMSLAFSVLPLDSFFNAATIRGLIAISLTIAFMRFTRWSLLRHKIKHEHSSALKLARQATTAIIDQSNAAQTITVVFASQTGYAEQLAELSYASLSKAEQTSLRIEICDIKDLDLRQQPENSRLLLIASTTGEGDAPDSAATIMATLAEDDLDLSRLSYAILALGDRHYQAFCAFGHALDRALQGRGAQRIFETIEVDDGNEAALQQWQNQLAQLTGQTKVEAWQNAAYQQWTLVERQQLNIGSLGAPIMWLRLKAPVDVKDVDTWQAGDIVEVFPGPAEQAKHSSSSTPAHREYSIASVPSDGFLELVVRQAYQADGSPGLASTWLNTQASLGAPIAARIRSNRSFHEPDPHHPMILIGNGTGIAGLRAHLKQRQVQHAQQNWLIFGERQREYDFLFKNELEAMQENGYLNRLDLAFSRDQTTRVYVQDKLREAGTELQAWIDNGAAIYVCGSLQGMAAEVDQALRDILGDAGVDQLREQGRYRRDVY